MTIYEQLGAEPRVEVGAVLRVGRRNEQTGNPEQNHRFFVASPIASDYEFTRRDGKKYKSPGRPMHPDFAPFNNAAASRCTTLNGFIARERMEDAFKVVRRAAELPKHPRHPGYRPTCESFDGQIADRYYGDKPPEGVEAVDGFATLKCPGERCQYAIGDDPPCKRRGWLLFYPRWTDPDWEHMGQVLMRFYTGSPASVNMILGGFEEARQQAAGLGIEIRNWYGLPIQLTVAMTTSRSKGRRFPLVRMTTTGSLPEWLGWQRAKAQEIGGVIQQKLISATTTNDDLPDRDLDEVDTEPPRVPSGGQGSLLDEPS